MDAAQRMALDAVIRRAVARDLDQLAGELERVRREIRALRLAAGLPLDPPEVERRERVAAMRRRGMSVRSIALAVGVHRATVTADLRTVGVPRPPQIVGLDGRTTPGPRPSPAGSVNGWQAAG